MISDALVIHNVFKARALLDVLDRVLDKGIVFDTWRRISVAGIDLITVEAHVIVFSDGNAPLRHRGQPA